MKIHQVVSHRAISHRVDPLRGHVVEHVEQLTAGSAERVKHEGVLYEVDLDGAFEMPEHHARFFLKQPGWYAGPSPFHSDVAPHAAPVEHSLNDDSNATLLARIAELETIERDQKSKLTDLASRLEATQKPATKQKTANKAAAAAE